MKINILISFIVILLFNSCKKKEVEIGFNERGVMFEKFGGGVDTTKVYEPGRYNIPDYNQLIIYNVDLNKKEEEFVFKSKDGIRMIANIQSTYKPIPDKISLLHFYIGKDYYKNVVRRGIQNTIENYFEEYLVNDIDFIENGKYNDELFPVAKKEISKRYVDLESLEIRELIKRSLPEAESKIIDNKEDGKESNPIVETNTTEMIVDDESKYSEKFYGGLKSYKGMETIELIGGEMILDKKDSISFPEIPTINKMLKFTGRKEDLAIALTLERINYTSIKYELEMVEFGKSSKIENGIADLGSFFFLGSESDTDEIKNINYLSTEFSSEIGSCYTNIRIGNVENSMNKPLLVKLVKNCNGEIRNIDLDNFPALREK